MSGLGKEDEMVELGFIRARDWRLELSVGVEGRNRGDYLGVCLISSGRGMLHQNGFVMDYLLQSSDHEAEGKDCLGRYALFGPICMKSLLFFYTFSVSASFFSASSLCRYRRYPFSPSPRGRLPQISTTPAAPFPLQTSPRPFPDPWIRIFQL